MASTGRPADSEYHPFYKGYIGLVTEDDVVEALEKQIETFEAVAAAASKADKESYRYAPDKWTVRELFGHLIDAERVFGYRAHCMSRGEQAALPGFDEKTYIAQSAYDEEPLADLAQELALLRRANLITFRRVDAQSGWDRTGNANGSNITMRGLAYVTLGHVRHHLGVLRDRYGVDA